jgi:hypothetical protein
MRKSDAMRCGVGLLEVGHVRAVQGRGKPGRRVRLQAVAYRYRKPCKLPSGSTVILSPSGSPSARSQSQQFAGNSNNND